MGIARKHGKPTKRFKKNTNPLNHSDGGPRRPMTGLNLTPEQRVAALNYNGPENIGVMAGAERGETNAEFQRNRRMFAIKGDQYYVAEKNNSASHKEWMVKEGILTGWDDPDYEMIPRGFFLRDQLHIYRGSNFKGDGRCIAALELYIEELQEAMEISDDTTIWVGASPGDNLAQWRGHMMHGTVREIIENRRD